MLLWNLLYFSPLIVQKADKKQRHKEQREGIGGRVGERGRSGAGAGVALTGNGNAANAGESGERRARQSELQRLKNN